MRMGSFFESYCTWSPILPICTWYCVKTYLYLLYLSLLFYYYLHFREAHIHMSSILKRRKILLKRWAVTNGLQQRVCCCCSNHLLINNKTIDTTVLTSLVLGTAQSSERCPVLCWMFCQQNYYKFIFIAAKRTSRVWNLGLTGCIK